MSQTSYSQTLAAAIAGLIADLRTKVVESFAAQEAIPFGAACVAGTDPEKQVKLPTAAGVATEVFRGIAVHTHAVNMQTTPVGYSTKETVGVLTRGQAWVKVSSAVAADADAYVDHIGADGQFTDVPGALAANGAIVGKFRSVQGTVGGLALLEINLP